MSLLEFLAYSGLVAVSLGSYLAGGADLKTLLLGVNLGIGLTGAFLSALKLYRPDRYRFLHEVEGAEEP